RGVGEQQAEDDQAFEDRAKGEGDFSGDGSAAQEDGAEGIGREEADGGASQGHYRSTVSIRPSASRTGTRTGPAAATASSARAGSWTWRNARRSASEPSKYSSRSSR